MSNFSLPLTRLIHENLSILMTFCFSRKPLTELVEEKFKGEWKYLRKGLFDVSEQRAERACVELAMFIRLLDDEEDLSGYLRQMGTLSFGKLVKEGEREEQLGFRDVCNKIIHASQLYWNLSGPGRPILVCESRERRRWLRAEIDVVSLAAFCGNLMH